MRKFRFYQWALLALMASALAACGGGVGGGNGAVTGADHRGDTASASGNGTITGKVVDINTGSALSGVSVNDGVSQTVRTDSNGDYTLSEPAGNYTLNASVSGYLQTWQITAVSSGANDTVNWSLTKAYGTQKIPAANMSYIILAWNDLGMHCNQKDYSFFCVLPPANTLHAQVLRRGGDDAEVITTATVSYSCPKKMHPSYNTNYWTYAKQFATGATGSNWLWNYSNNTGITGTTPSGDMSLYKDPNTGQTLSYEAFAIPVTAEDDDGTWDPYAAFTVTAKDQYGNTLASTQVVAPISHEMDCMNCHGTSALDPTLTTYQSILHEHDRLSGTTLLSQQQAGTVYLCSHCHSDNILLETGNGAKALSPDMHNLHKDYMNLTSASANTKPDCFNCHPGPNTQCLRGQMYRAGKSCHDCHGDMTAMANYNRVPWGPTTSTQMGEPRCGQCHDAAHAENANLLYRDSLLNDSPSGDMNGRIYCEACHNSTHGEYTQANVAYNGSTINSSDTAIPMQYQGDKYWIWNCTVCHSATQQAMHHSGSS
ncbi:MAG: carboxypeptidase-like regulatory domain-containing protein, partial [Nitrospiraceae bacterium]|nr:carboxypeptidase-like regulatory domain-containing protein [Nitrospiraceae bacterium]